MSQQQRRIFVYRPPAPQIPENPPPEAEPDEAIDLTRWLFSPIGAGLVWALALVLSVLAAILALLVFPENYGKLAVEAGLWLVLGITVFHWWVPPGHPERMNAEGLAVAGWHVVITVLSTGFAALLLIDPAGFPPAFTMGDLYPVVVVGTILLVMYGIVLTLVRGHSPGRGLRYAWTIQCMLATWMTLWLVAAHAGL